MGTLQYLYDHAPVFAQNIAISGYGLWLRYLRYGRRQRAIIAELRQSERCSAADLAAMQRQRLLDVTAAAARDVPFYRDRLPANGIDNPDALRDVPLLTKADAQRVGRAMVSSRSAGRRLQEIHTGGTTGTPLVIYCDRATLQRNYAFFFRFRQWAGIGDADRVATFAGRTFVPPGATPPYWRHNWASRTLLCSSYHLSTESLPGYLDALAAFQPALIDSYPSSLEPLARYALQARDRRVKPKAIITSSETLFAETRDSISEAFGCRVFDHYGAAEMAALITQCEAGRYHINPEYGLVEILVDGKPARPGESGEIVATGFINPVMPFVRYATGDRAVAGEIGCPCGRSFPTIEQLEGRQDDVVVTPEGNRVGRLDPIFKAVHSIHEAQIVQDAADHVRVDIVARDEFSEAERRSLETELRRRLGPTMRISIQAVPAIERTGRGKLRTVINLVPRSRDR